jgi:hypothetical protein
MCLGCWHKKSESRRQLRTSDLATGMTFPPCVCLMVWSATSHDYVGYLQLLHSLGR